MPKAPQVSERSFLGKPEKQWVFINGDIFTLAVLLNIIVSSVLFSSITQSCPTVCDPMNHSTPGYTVHHLLLDPNLTHVHWVSDAMQTSHLLSYISSPDLNLSQHPGLFKYVSSSHQVPKYGSFSFKINPSNEYPGPISFRMGWLELLAVQATLKNLLQHHRWEVSIFQNSAFFIVQTWHP